METSLVNPFLSATMDVMEALAHAKVTPGPPTERAARPSNADVTGLCGLAGEQMAGSFAICFPQSTILALVSQMRGEPKMEVDGAVREAVGEIAEAIAASARKALAKKGTTLHAALPVVIAGDGHAIVHRTTGAVLDLPFASSAGAFFVEICFER